MMGLAHSKTPEGTAFITGPSLNPPTTQHARGQLAFGLQRAIDPATQL